MIVAKAAKSSLEPTTIVRVHQGRDLDREISRLRGYGAKESPTSLNQHLGWLMVMRDGLRHTPYLLEAVMANQTRGLLPLAYVRSFLFGKFLVSLPYLDQGGVLAEDGAAARLLIDRAVQLAESLNVRYLELRHGEPIDHPALQHRLSTKVQMRLPLPRSSEHLWADLDCKVRNQIRKGQKSGLEIGWGGQNLLGEFFSVFSQNMRDLGTPTYGKRLFASILARFPDEAELCVVRAGKSPAAAALLLHGRGMSDIPSASCVRRFNPTCANMLLYWHLLERAIQRNQSVFNFGRCNRDGPTYRFKAQWGAQPAPAEWQYFVRRGSTGEMRPENPRYRRLISLWRRLPVGLTRLIGPAIVRGIP